ncbi:KR domain-containing protein [Beauveria brongniartii RCEF 3172]|uniref:KR domain-containing protein n=1 Tax=Beauveria brongniartii RCEF 3172 TaxID=1081107 RepID=A0A167K8L9_9HYPO|nr:KR domain-containing protein [Beauveria brongniartii RCEF 3172]
MNGTPTGAMNGHPVNLTAVTPNGKTAELTLNARTNGHVEKQSHLNFSHARPEPIAICGVGIRLPGKIHTGAEFWHVLYHGKDVRSPIPSDRFNIDAFDGSLGNKNKISTKYAYCLDEHLGVLDASFFHMSKAELDKIDPQLRKTLEVTRECLENAGETGWRGKDIGVYVGTFGDDWLQSSMRESQVSGGYNFTGDLMLANRVSYEFDLHGPSASLVALHEACRALQQRDCSAALVSGTSLLMGPHIFKIMTDEGVLSPEGSCKTFDASADGFARAEGINTVFLKRITDAIRDGNPIRAVIRNSGNNCDGKTQGITSPRSDTQESLIRHVYAQARLDPSRTGFFECHGTGTAVGDPVECAAVGNVFGEEGIYIGSVKPNTGHSEGASGLTSLIKAILALEHKIIPPNIKFNTPNPNIEFKRHKLVVPLEPTSWPKNRAERVSINSFGIGGSNAHVIIDSAEQFFTEHPRLARSCATFTNRRKFASPQLLLLLSANTAESVKQFAREIIDYTKRQPEVLNDLAHTLASRREKLPYRSYLVASKDGTATEAAPPVKVPLQKISRIFVFSGQGAQWPQMARGLVLGHSVFSQTIDELDHVLQTLKNPPAWKLRDELLKPKNSSQVSQPELSQPLTTAVQIGLVNILKRLGITANAVIGHSSGEISAAFAAGIVSSRDAIIVSYLRGLATRFQPSKGGMAAVGLSAKAVQAYLLGHVVIAAENSGEATTISGDSTTLDQVLANIKADRPDTLARRLQVNMAYHSPHMVPVGEVYLDMMEGVFGTAKAWPISKGSTTSMFSTVTTKVIDKALDLEYWVENLTSTVQFSNAFSAALTAQGFQPLVLEIGPHSQMAGPIREICKTVGVQSSYLPTVIRGADCLQSIAATVGQLFQQGVEMNMAADSTIFPRGKVLTDMPLYAWNHTAKYWNENRISRDWRFRKYGHHALLGEIIPETNALEPSWRCMLDLEDEPWLRDHMMSTDIVFPLAGYISMAGEAIRQVTETIDFVGYAVKHVVVHTALVLHESKPTEVALTLRRCKLTDKSDSKY